jgi:non-specific serine/threonine protein kinase
MIGRKLAHYTLVEELGSGSMGRVFAAYDSHLDRKVALKLLPKELAEDRELLVRLEQEAKSLAALNHPNIVSVYSVEESDGHRFFTMELVEGSSLDRLIPAGGFAQERLLEIAIPLVEGLAAAHRRGLVHRDIKPGNVMLGKDGRLRILDFGLAKRLELSDAITEVRTEEGSLVGTGPYMAPEQVRGDAVDSRTDVYALGVVLYEMATGGRPFRGGSAPELLSAILRDRPKSLRSRCPSLSPRLARLVERCLEKSPDDRWQSTVDLLHELRSIAAGEKSEVERPRSIAVLPFADMSPARDQDFFCDGMAEELIGALNRIEGLRVASRTSSFRFRGAVDLREVGAALGVDTVLEGSVRKAGDKLRISVDLVNVEDGYARLSQTFDRQLEDVFAIQQEIAAAVAGELRGALSESERRALAPPEANVEAYELYLRGRQFFSQYKERGMLFALGLFERTIEVDPAYAPAFAGIADCCSFLYANAGREGEHLARALEASSTALELDPRLASAHTARAVALSLDGRVEEADAAFERALELDSRFFDAEYFYARHCFTHGKAEAAIEHYRRAFALRPEDYQSPLLAAQIYEDLGRDEEATAARRDGIRAAERHLRLNPDDSRALYMAANGMVASGETERGLEWAGRARELEPGDSMVLYNLACIYSMAGAVDDAIGCLEAALAHGFANRLWLERDSNLDNVRREARFSALLESLSQAEVGTEAT